MAARLNPKQDARSREAIKTTQLVKRLQSFAFEETDDAGQVVEIDGPRLKAIEILLRKSLPDLSAVQMAATHDLTDPVQELLSHIADKGSRLGSK